VKKGRVYRGKMAVMAAVVLATGMTARAGSIIIQNPSFETDVLGDGAYNGAISDWTNLNGGSEGAFNPNVGTSYYTSAGLAQIVGNNVAYSNGGVISQTLGTNFAPNTTYTLSLLVGDRSDVNNSGTTFSYGLYDGTTALPVDSSGLLAETPAFGVDTNVTDPSENPAPANKGTFITETLTYTTGAGALADPIEIELYASSVQYDFDNVTLSSSTFVSLPAGPTGVPLPGTAATMPALLGLAGMIGYWRSSKRRRTLID
jgi:hypothetical protein